METSKNVYPYPDFELSMDIAPETIIKAVNALYPDMECPVDPDGVQWHYYGNYILFYDGGMTSLYFTHKYLRVGGRNLFDKQDIDRCFEILKSNQS